MGYRGERREKKKKEKGGCQVEHALMEGEGALGRKTE